MAIIDILCVIDTNLLRRLKISSGTLEHPTNLGANHHSDAFIFMICDGQFAVNHQGGSELTIKANVGDTIRWTITDPSTGLAASENAQSFSCILYNFQSKSKNISKPSLKSAAAISYYNSQTSPTTPEPTEYMCSSWTSSILAVGNIQYDWAFQVIDNYSGEVVGYYTWDPYINVAIQ